MHSGLGYEGYVFHKQRQLLLSQKYDSEVSLACSEYRVTQRLQHAAGDGLVEAFWHNRLSLTFDSLYRANSLLSLSY